MVFRLNNVDRMSASTVKSYIRYKGFKRISCYSFGAAEVFLNKYLKEKYGYKLRDLCKILLLNCTIAVSDKDVVITFLDRKFDRLASLITYGNGIFRGSDILKDAFYGLKGAA